jgi:hypothetical protein
MLIYESPEAFAARKSDATDPYTGAWRAYYKAMVEAGCMSAAIRCRYRTREPR